MNAIRDQRGVGKALSQMSRVAVGVSFGLATATEQIEIAAIARIHVLSDFFFIIPPFLCAIRWLMETM